MKTLAYMHTHIINEGLISELGKIKKAQNVNLEVVLFINNVGHFIKKSSNNAVQELEFYGLKIKCVLCDEKIIKALNLPLNAFYNRGVSIGECFWFNCDYSFYIMRHFFADFDFYWQIQYDAFYNDKDYVSFFQTYKNDTNDLLITHFRQESMDSEWVWINDTQWVYNQNKIYGSLWVVARMSRNLIDALYRKRIEYDKIFAKPSNDKRQWLLCEIFVATECIKMGFSAKTLQNDKTGITEIDLNTTRLFDKPDKCLYHPVKGGLLKRLEFGSEAKIREFEKLKELEHFRGFARFYAHKKLAKLRKNTRTIRYPIKAFFKRLFSH